MAVGSLSQRSKTSCRASGQRGAFAARLLLAAVPARLALWGDEKSRRIGPSPVTPTSLGMVPVSLLFSLARGVSPDLRIVLRARLSDSLLLGPLGDVLSSI